MRFQMVLVFVLFLTKDLIHQTNQNQNTDGILQA